MIKIEENVDSKNYSTMKIGGYFRYFTIISKEKDLPLIYAIAQKNGKYKNIPIFVLGGGSNTIFPDKIFNALIVKIDIKGFEILRNSKNFIDIKVGAGEIFDNIVVKTINMGLSGFEALSKIPGTIGATPIQNVGAYGAEVGSLIKKVIVFDKKNNKIKNISQKECHFEYRNSIFKSKYKGRYIILYVVYRLSKKSPKIPNYIEVINYFKDRKISKPKLKDIRRAIINIRMSKLPDWKILPNSGSFFENPIISKKLADKIRKNYPNIRTFNLGDSKVKIPAGWLIDNVGLKGKSFGKISVYDKNALVLVNNGGATKSDLLKAKNKIIKIVKDKFGIILEIEPNIL